MVLSQFVFEPLKRIMLPSSQHSVHGKNPSAFSLSLLPSACNRIRGLTTHLHLHPCKELKRKGLDSFLFFSPLLSFLPLGSRCTRTVSNSRMNSSWLSSSERTLIHYSHPESAPSQTQQRPDKLKPLNYTYHLVHLK